MYTKAGGSDHLFLFTYGNELLWEMLSVLIFMIYLFIYWKRCKQKQVEDDLFLFTYGNRFFLDMCFSF